MFPSRHVFFKTALLPMFTRTCILRTEYSLPADRAARTAESNNACMAWSVTVESLRLAACLKTRDCRVVFGRTLSPTHEASLLVGVQAKHLAAACHYGPR